MNSTKVKNPKFDHFQCDYAAHLKILLTISLVFRLPYGREDVTCEHLLHRKPLIVAYKLFLFLNLTRFPPPAFFTNDSRRFPEVPACFASGKVYELSLPRLMTGLISGWLSPSCMIEFIYIYFTFPLAVWRPPNSACCKQSTKRTENEDEACKVKLLRGAYLCLRTAPTFSACWTADERWC